MDKHLSITHGHAKGLLFNLGGGWGNIKFTICYLVQLEESLKGLRCLSHTGPVGGETRSSQTSGCGGRCLGVGPFAKQTWQLATRRGARKGQEH